MKSVLVTIAFVSSLAKVANSQTARYFEFTTNCGHGNWQDTSFIAATSNQAVIDNVLTDLAKLFDQRRFIAGSIDNGAGGFNHNADHWFLWHFIPDQWELAESAIEVCDGCPYSDVDADTAYWIGVLGQYCPWSGKPVREILDPVTGTKDSNIENEITIYPNPALNKLNLKWNGLNNISVVVHNSIGQEIMDLVVSNQNAVIDIADLRPGLYFVKVKDLRQRGVKKFVVEN